MYLSEEIYVGAHYDHNHMDTSSCRIVHKGRELPIEWSKLSELTLQRAYWRKANHIHRWFVDNVQEGNDDCNEYEVSWEKLKELYLLCKKILDMDPGKERDKFAKDHLPPSEGFFFSGTEIDKLYYQDLVKTIDQLDDIFADTLENKILNDASIYRTYKYHSSW